MDTMAAPLPGPRGPVAAVRGISAYGRDPFQFFVDLRESHGDIMRIWNPGFPLAVIYHPEMVEHVLVRNARNYHKDAYLRQWKEVFGEGLLTAEGEHWRRERRLLQPMFARERLDVYAARMRALAADAFDGWKAGEVRAVNRDVMALTLRIVVDTLFGAETDAATEARVAAAFGACSRYFVFTGEPLGSWLSRFPFPVRRRYVRAVRELDDIIGGIIAERRQQPGRGDLLGLLLEVRDEDGSAMTDEQLRDEIMTMFLAGHETTSLAVTYTLHLFSRHPESQERVRAGDAEHLERFIKESMRLYPPAWTLVREAIGDDTIAGFRVPAGTNLVIPTWAIHRDPRFFPEPLQFSPDRWTAEWTRALPRAAYLPFGAGARMCIGFQFAMSEIQILLSEALSRFRFSPADDAPLEFEASITMRPRNDVRLSLS
jgi:cytochrome P450